MLSDDIRKTLEEKYPYSLELHAHTSPASGCASISPVELLDVLHKNGCDAVAITNHFYKTDMEKDAYIEKFRKDYFDALEHGKKLGMKVYLGAELRFKNECGNDYLFYGYDVAQLEEMYGYLDGTLEEFVSGFKTDDMFITQAHPFRGSSQRGYEKFLDGIEAFNVNPGSNTKIVLAMKYARQCGKPYFAGTDYHHLNEDYERIAATRTANIPENERELVKLFKSGDYLCEVAGKILI